MNSLILTVMGSIIPLLFFYKDCIGVKYLWERYEPPYPTSYGLNSILLFFCKYCFGIKYAWARYEHPYPARCEVNDITAILLQGLL